MADMQANSYITRNKPTITQAFGNSISHLHPNGSTSLAGNYVRVNPPDPRSDRTQPPRTGSTDDQSHYHAGDWSGFNACDLSTNQGRWNNFTSMPNPELCDWSVFNTASGKGREKWNYLSSDWDSFNATFKFNNAPAGNI
jgi:hypothetical protein